ncbi:homoserine O-succinyltransferase [Parelusimicrobium proximum]|uniref:homoserine O-succinyltransferase n=1 Tax=Parelusimicrobium proximum TaxID=3228953 RepID=UPI003D171E27
MKTEKLNICILNLMPTKEVTERQLTSLLGIRGDSLNITLLTTESYQSKNTDAEYLREKYKIFSQVKDKSFDILILTGAPIEHLAFEEVAYWNELKEILEFSKTNTLFNIFICWGAQAALYYFHGINKVPLANKYFGIFEQNIENKKSIFYKDIENNFLIPHSRHTSVLRKDIESKAELIIECASGDEISVISSADLKNIFITGHPEYDADTLHLEYARDITKGVEIQKPVNYYPRDNAEMCPGHRWRKDAEQFYRNILTHVANLKLQEK